MSGAAKFCHCGRALGHSGRHVGSPHSLEGKPARLKPGPKGFAAKLEAECAATQAKINQLKAELRRTQAAIVTAETTLQALVALKPVYGIAGPEAPKGVPFRIGAR